MIKTPRTEAEMRDALQRLIDAAYGKRTRPCFSIPVQSSDADVILQDVIEEVLRYRSKDTAHE